MIDFSILDQVIDEIPTADVMVFPKQDRLYTKGTCDDIMQLLTEKEEVHFVTNGAFSLHDLVDKCVLRLGHIHTITLSTFSFTELPARMLGNWIEQGIVKDIYALLDVRARANYPGVFQQLQQLCKAVAIAPVHAKVTILEGANETIIIVGSANWTTNPRFEVGHISVCKSLAQFHKDWIINEIQLKHTNGKL